MIFLCYKLLSLFFVPFMPFLIKTSDVIWLQQIQRFQSQKLSWPTTHILGQENGSHTDQRSTFSRVEAVSKPQHDTRMIKTRSEVEFPEKSHMGREQTRVWEWGEQMRVIEWTKGNRCWSGNQKTTQLRTSWESNKKSSKCWMENLRQMRSNRSSSGNSCGETWWREQMTWKDPQNLWNSLKKQL